MSSNPTLSHIILHSFDQDVLLTLQADSKTARLKAAVESNAGIWREVTSMAEADLADLVRSDGVDVLVELTGLTANNRLGVMAMRPAPVQART